MRAVYSYFLILHLGGGDSGGAGAIGVADLENEINQNLPNRLKLDLTDRGVLELIERAKEKLNSASTEWEHRITELRILRFLALEQYLNEFSAADHRKLAPCLNFALQVGFGPEKI